MNQCVCILWKVRYYPFLTIMCECAISYKNSWHTSNLAATHWLQNTALTESNVDWKKLNTQILKCLFLFQYYEMSNIAFEKNSARDNQSF